MNEHDQNEMNVQKSLAEIGEVTERQLGTSAPQPKEFEDGALIRFSPNLKEKFTADERRALQQRAESLAPWLQGPFLLGDDLVVGGAWRTDTRWVTLAGEVPDLKGKRVLDVGSNAGYDPFRFSLLGPAELVACEPFAFISQMRFLEEIYQAGIQIREIGWQGLDPEKMGRFDLVHCHGVLYHEPNPIGMLEALYDMTADGGTFIFGSMMHADPSKADLSRLVPLAYFGDDTWWWTPGPIAMWRMLESVGFEVEKTFGVSDGPPGEFATINGYFRARRPSS
jgi:SAM-dependent methyltransferase